MWNLNRMPTALSETTFIFSCVDSPETLLRKVDIFHSMEYFTRIINFFPRNWELYKHNFQREQISFSDSHVL